MRAAVAVASLLLAAPAVAALDPAGRCCADKLRATAGREKQVFRCHARAAAAGTAVDPACLDRAGAALARSFARIEARGGCPGPGDAAVVRADVERVVAGVAGVLRPVATASACAARKLKAAGKRAASALRDFSRFAPRPADHLAELDPLAQAHGAALQAAFARLEAGGGCLTTGDATAVWQRILAGLDAPAVPDGVLLTSLRVCPACGDGVRGGAEACDGADQGACDGACLGDCTCALCGDGAVNRPAEACDGADDAACPGLCAADCTCPSPVCGNGVVEQGETCDGSDPGVCVGPASCSATCQCCDGGVCGILGCCDPTDVCLAGPSGFGSCFQARCRPDRPCPAGYTCAPHPTTPSEDGFCLANVGTACGLVPHPVTPIVIPCAPPAVCSGTIGTCCLPAGTGCGAAGECCSGSCSASVCD